MIHGLVEAGDSDVVARGRVVGTRSSFKVRAVLAGPRPRASNFRTWGCTASRCLFRTFNLFITRAESYRPSHACDQFYVQDLSAFNTCMNPNQETPATASNFSITSRLAANATAVDPPPCRQQTSQNCPPRSKLSSTPTCLHQAHLQPPASLQNYHL